MLADVDDVKPIETVASAEDGDYVYVELKPSDEPVVQGRASPVLVIGQPCPACGKKVGRRTERKKK